MLFFATVLNYMDRQTLSVCAPQIRREFQLSNENYGDVVSAFRWAYAALHIPAGLIADRFSVRFFYAAAVAFWSLAGASTAFAAGIRSLLATRAALGLGEAFNWPCALRVTANILPPQDRSLGNGIFQSGTAIGALIAPLIIVPIADAHGWRLPFILVGAFGGVWVVVWLLMTRPSGSQRSVESPEVRAAGTPEALIDWQKLVHPIGLVVSIARSSIARNPGFWVLLVAAGTINPCMYFLAEWTANYLHDQRGMNEFWAGLATTWIFLGLDLGNLAAGGGIAWFTSRGWTLRRARASIVVLGGLLVPAASIASVVDSEVACIVALSISAFGIAVLMVNLLACYQEVAFRSVGLVMGLMGAFGCIVAATVNPYIGRYVDRTGHYHLVFVLLGVLPLITLGSILTFDWIKARRHVE
jgi:ACS family hexuronate transporter-like MFS transporter